MAIDYSALALVHPELPEAVPQFLPETATVFRAEPVTAASTGDDAFGYPAQEGDPETPAPDEIGSYRCALGEYKNREGKPEMVVNSAVIVVPWEIQFFVSDEPDVQAGDELRLQGRVFKVLVPPSWGSFDVLACAYCQEVL